MSTEKIERSLKVNKQVYCPSVENKSKSTMDVELIEFEDEFLRIDFIVRPDLKYDSGWWMSIDPRTFIRPVGENYKLKLIKTRGIRIAPAKYYFPHKNHEQRFSLYFPLPPTGVKAIDIIEREFGGEDYFNFYNVSLQAIRMKAILVGLPPINLN